MLHLEDLVLLDRRRSYERLLEHLRIDSEPQMLTFFEEELTPERAHLGRWQAGLDTEERDATTAAYQAILQQLRDEGVACAPPERSLDVTHEPGEQTVSPLDPWSRRSMDLEP